MPHSVQPEPLVFSTICPPVYPVAMLFIVLVLSFISSPIGPLVSAETVLLIIDPVTSINCPIGIPIRTLSIHFIMPPYSNVDVAVSERISSNSILLGVNEVTLITRAINELLNAFTLPLITYPISIVRVTLPRFEAALPMSFSFLEMTGINAAVWINEYPASMGNPIQQKPNITRPVIPIYFPVGCQCFTIG